MQSQLYELNEWLPLHRVEQYRVGTEKMRLRLKRVVDCCISADMFGKAISDRLSAWQDAVGNFPDQDFLFTKTVL
jgi:hypothetical protein